MKINWGVLFLLGIILAGVLFLVIYRGPHIDLAFIGFFVLIFSLVFGNSARNFLLKRRLQKEGLPGTGRLVQADTTGMSSNNDPEMKLTLAVTGQDGKTWDAVVRQFIPQSQLYALAPGTVFNVLYDPGDRSKVVLGTSRQSASASSAHPAANPADIAAITQAYQHLIAEQDAVQRRLAGGTLAPAKVLTYTQIAVSTNQIDPVVTLLLDVQPEHGQPFTGQVNVGIQATRVEHFAPGCTIYVRYDPSDLSEVALVGSEKPASGF